MPHYRSVGEIPRTRHVPLRKPDGGLYAEELMGVEGFSADSALLYHQYMPTAIVDARMYPEPATRLSPNLPLLPRHLRTHKLDGWAAARDPDPAAGRDAVTGRALLLANGDVRISYAVADRVSPLYRNTVGDECVYVESGTAVLETGFGSLAAGPGDYVILPTSTTHRWRPDGEGPLRMLVIETTGRVSPPRRYLSARGQFLQHAPYCERDLRGPTAPLIVEGSDVQVLVQHRSGMTQYTYAHHPFDVVGWDGCLYPWAFNIADFEPTTGRIPQPPPVNQTFEGPGFVVCSFVPRKVGYKPQAVPMPYNHANVDSDEVMFYTGGSDADEGAGIRRGSIALHPSGFTHGPQPGSVQRAPGAETFDELAVMVDTFRPLNLAEAALACEDPGYPWTWAGRHNGTPPEAAPPK